MKKTFCLLLCFVMLLSVLVGCKKKDQPTTDTTPGDTQPTDANSDSSSDTGIRYDIEHEDFSVNGVRRDFLMAVRDGRYHYLDADKSAVERVERATYTRNSFIEENYGVNIVAVPLQDSKSTWATQLAVTDGTLDVAVPDFGWLLEHQGLFINLNDKNVLNRNELRFEQEYWYAAWNDGVTINDRLYTVVGDASLEIWENIEIVFFNKTKASTVNLYEIVDKGEWTIDQMLVLSRNASSALDDSDTSNDVYGTLYDQHSLRSQLFSAGMKIIDTSQGTLNLVAQDYTLNLDICDKVTTLINDYATKYNATTARADATSKVKMFTGGKTMFYATALYLGYTINSQNNVPTFGVLPMPKYDADTQSEYITTAYGASPFAIPKICTDYHFAAKILDALNYYSADKTLDAFYNKTMRGQLAEGSDDVRMLDLVRDTMYFDVGWMYDNNAQFCVFSAFQKAVAGNTEVQLATAMSSSSERLSTIINFYNT